MSDLKQPMNWKKPNDINTKKVWFDCQIHEKTSKITRLKLDIEDIKKLQIVKLQFEIEQLQEDVKQLEEEKKQLDTQES